MIDVHHLEIAIKGFPLVCHWYVNTRLTTVHSLGNPTSLSAAYLTNSLLIAASSISRLAPDSNIAYTTYTRLNIFMDIDDILAWYIIIQPSSFCGFANNSVLILPQITLLFILSNR